MQGIRSKGWAAVVLGFLVTVVGACAESPTGEDPMVFRVEISPAALDTFHVLRDTARLTAIATRADGAPAPEAQVRWGVESPGVADVSDDGLVTAINAGHTAVVAMVSGDADTVVVVVDPVAAGIEIRPPSVTLAPRGVIPLQAVVKDSAGNTLDRGVVDWASTDSSIAWVDPDGRAFGGRLGTVVVTALYNGLTDTLTLDVSRVSGSGPFAVWSRDTTVIAGVLDLPSGPGPYPTMVRVHGSGPRTRTSGLFAASTLIPAGVALLRYDKRGVGESGGRYAGIGTDAVSTQLLHRLGDDAAAWLDFLTHHEAVDTARLGLLGVSQGGWINPIAAARSPHVRYMINVVGPTISVGQQIYYQTLTGSTGGGQNNSGLSDQELVDSVAAFSGRMGYDPQPELEELTIPGLWVLGTKDYLVPYGNTVATIDSVVTLTGSDYSVITLDSATHGTRHIVTGELVPWWDVAGGGFEWLSARGFFDA